MPTSLDRFQIELIPIPAGSIVLKDDRTRQQWSVALKSFALANAPVTQAQHAAVTGK
jgi:formylglycine-generating enzyme required for sulfatase activity